MDPPTMSELTHFDAQGQAHMVDVAQKAHTHRVAVAQGRIHMQAHTLELIASGHAKKGDVLGVARLAGIMAAKKTSELIPLCHPLALTRVTVGFELEPERHSVVCKASAESGGPGHDHHRRAFVGKARGQERAFCGHGPAPGINRALTCFSAGAKKPAKALAGLGGFWAKTYWFYLGAPVLPDLGAPPPEPPAAGAPPAGAAPPPLPPALGAPPELDPPAGAWLIAAMLVVKNAAANKVFNSFIF
jgi:molybdenum cofactor biosynthesis protein MoaC